MLTYLDGKVRWCSFHCLHWGTSHHDHIAPSFHSEFPNGHPPRTILNRIGLSTLLAMVINPSTSQLAHRNLLFKNRASGLASQTLKLAGNDTTSQSVSANEIQLISVLHTIIWKPNSIHTSSLSVHIGSHNSWLNVEDTQPGILKCQGIPKPEDS